MPPRGGRKLGLATPAEKESVVASLRQAHEAALCVCRAYRVNSIPYRAAELVAENCKDLAGLISGNERVFDMPLHSVSSKIRHR